jgi:RsiW-degrading membrane proteinase PrsW (M82 family)
MERPRDPVQARFDDGRDLYDVATWEPRSVLDRLSAVVYRGLVTSGRLVVITLALVILLSQLVIVALAVRNNPYVGAFALLSIVPALGLAAYVWYADITTNEPLTLLVGTFLLGILFASFAAVGNSLARPGFFALGAGGVVLFFYVIVAPIEETVKWLAIRLWAFRSDRFDAVVDGAVYGAMAGLGFATIENAIYITNQYQVALEAGRGVFEPTLQTAAIRTFAGPGHVIYSAFAGYYLGLAKFNRENAGPIVVKGILVAALIHATYNTLVSFLPGLVAYLANVPEAAAFIGFVIVYDGIFAYVLLRKLGRYRRAYNDANTTKTVNFGEESVERDSFEE